MCTVTWLRSETGYDLFFNRDEHRSRQEALPPRVSEARGVRWLAPVDGDFGGTWLAANECGITVGILNGYRETPDESGGPARSRGLLVLDLAGARTLSELESRLREEDLLRYRSFRLFAIGLESPLWVAEWDRRELVIDRDGERRIPLISSSIEESEVGARRRAEFHRLMQRVPLAVDELDAYHRGHDGGPSPYSVCMHRVDASTRSLTHVAMTESEVRLRYHAGPPCTRAEDVLVRLARRSSERER
jgi:hypothetical protein